MNDATQFICVTDPDCLCIEGDGAELHNDDGSRDFGGECLCAVVETEKRCSNCGAAMVEINVDTGEPVAA